MDGRVAGGVEPAGFEPTEIEPTEIEAKHGVTRPRVLARVIRRADPDVVAGFAGVGEAHLVRLTDRYLDTDPAGGRLAAANVRARLRRVGNTVTLTFKRAGVEQGGVTTRVELEAPASGSLDPRRWPDSTAKAALLAVAGTAPLHEVGRLRQRRLTRMLRRDSASVEVSLDSVDVLVEGRVVARRHELEVELKQGDPADLAELVVALAGVDGVVPALGSKLGFALEAIRDARQAAEPGGDIPASSRQDL